MLTAYILYREALFAETEIYRISEENVFTLQ